MGFYIYTGHESSSSSEVISDQYSLGLTRPLKSHAYQMHIDDITSVLIKFQHKKSTELDKKIIDGLVVDFLLANLSHKNWGWYSQNNLYVLDFWKKKSEDVKFVLVFDSPIYIFRKITDQRLNQDNIESKIYEWLEYHQKMLSFFNKSPNRCILIEGKVVKSRKMELARHLGLSQLNDLGYSDQDCGEVTSYDSYDYIASEIIRKKYHKALDLYSLMQERSLFKTTDVYPSSLEMLISLMNDYKCLADENSGLYSRFTSLTAQIVEKEQENLVLNENIQNLKNEIVLLKEQAVASRQSSQPNQIEYKDLLSLLHSTQERLERYELLDYESKCKTFVLNENIQNLKNEIVLLKEQAVASRQSSQPNQIEYKDLLSLLHSTQERLERYELLDYENEHIEMRENLNKVERSIVSTFVHKPIRVVGAANRVKQDLPYRLGSVLVKNSKDIKSVFSIPRKLVGEYRDFSDMKNNQPTLPLLDDYQDREKADRVKQQLSYRLGNVLVDSIHSPRKTIGLPYYLTKEVILFKMSKKK